MSQPTQPDESLTLLAEELAPYTVSAAVSKDPAAPAPQPPPEDWEHRELYEAVMKALYALPSYFKTDLNITGILATDLFTFNTSLGATIETQVVAALNEIRPTWDPTRSYSLYSFVRQSQRFPDVILRASAQDIEPGIVMGIELKGWYVLAKEKEPSFRYRITPDCCAPADLLVVYPWALSNVISGSPLLFQPYVVPARFAAEYRNYWWQHIKVGGERNRIRLSSVNHFYPQKSELSSDVPEHDDGSNFGRFARTGLMDAYMRELFEEELSGIPLVAWQKFLSAFSEERTETQINRAINQAIKEAEQTHLSPADTIEAIKSLLQRILDRLG
jgi:hypothetical protein